MMRLVSVKRRHAISVAAGSADRVLHNRLDIVIREGIVQPRRGRGFTGWVRSGMHADPFLPQSEMAQNLFAHLPVVTERNDTHFSGAVRTQQRIGLPYLI